MSRLARAAAGITLTAALTVGCFVPAPAAHASEPIGTAPSLDANVAYEQLSSITAAQVDQAIAEARMAGLVQQQTIAESGTVTTTIALDQGFTIELVQRAVRPRMSAGKDGRGMYIGFNATDQNMIISGAAFGLGAGVCAVGGPAICLVAGAVITMATVAITGSGAIRCGTKSLRVYPLAGGKVKPRCA